MKQQRRRPVINIVPRMIACTAIVITVFAALACTSKGSSTASRDKDARPGSAVGEASGGSRVQGNADPGIDLNCVYNHLQNPPEPFHYVYKKTESDGSGVDQEADITPQAIDGVRLQPDGTPNPVHATRSDSSSWQAALANLTGISGMSSTVSTFNHNSAMRRESDGALVNGYQTIHYSIDTARWDETTRQMLGSFTLGPGGFDKGDAWVTSEGCPVKITLDDEMHKTDGSLIGKVHYEEAMVKK
jgi:hypothetical protein